MYTKLFECFFKTIWSYISIFFFPFILNHYNTFVLASHHKSIPHYCLISHCLLKFVFWINLQRLLISVTSSFYCDSNIQINFESYNWTGEIFNLHFEILGSELSPLTLFLFWIYLLKQKNICFFQIFFLKNKIFQRSCFAFWIDIKNHQVVWVIKIVHIFFIIDLRLAVFFVILFSSFIYCCLVQIAFLHIVLCTRIYLVL